MVLQQQQQLRNESHAGHEGDEVSSPAAGPAGTGDRPIASCGTPGLRRIVSRLLLELADAVARLPGVVPRCIGLRRAS